MFWHSNDDDVIGVFMDVNREKFDLELSFDSSKISWLGTLNFLVYVFIFAVWVIFLGRSVGLVSLFKHFLAIIEQVFAASSLSSNLLGQIWHHW